MSSSEETVFYVKAICRSYLGTLSPKTKNYLRYGGGTNHLILLLRLVLRCQQGCCEITVAFDAAHLCNRPLGDLHDPHRSEDKGGICFSLLRPRTMQLLLSEIFLVYLSSGLSQHERS